MQDSFLTTVLDVLQNGDTRLAILDGSAACHMPDVLEMPYRPPLLGAENREKMQSQSGSEDQPACQEIS